MYTVWTMNMVLANHINLVRSASTIFMYAIWIMNMVPVRTASPNEVTRNFLHCIVILTYVTVILT